MLSRLKFASRTRIPHPRRRYRPELLQLEDRLVPGDALGGLLPWSVAGTSDALGLLLFPGAKHTVDEARLLRLTVDSETSSSPRADEVSATPTSAAGAPVFTRESGATVYRAPDLPDQKALYSAASAVTVAGSDHESGPTLGPSGSYTVSLLGRLNQHPSYAGVWGYVDAEGGEYALLGTRNGTSIVNVTDPTNPVQVAFIPGPVSGWREIQTYGTYAYVTTEGGGGVQIIDLSNLPNDARLAGTYRTTVGNAHSLFIDTDSGYAYINGASQPPSQSRGGMNILDLNQDPTQPVEVGRYTTRYTHDSFVRNFGEAVYAFTSELSAGFSIVDVTDPASPQVLANRRYSGNFTHNGWLTQDSRYFLTTDENAGGHLRVWDWWDLGNIVQVGAYSAHPQATIHNVYGGTDFAVAAYYAEGLRIIDMTDPTLPVEAGYFDTHPEWVTGFRGAWGAYPYLPSGNILLMDISTGLWIVSFDGTYAGRLRGVVRNADSGQLIAGATIRLEGVNQPQTTNAQGEYGIGYVPDTYTLTVSRAGFQTYTESVTLLSGKTLALDIDMQSQ